MTDFEQRIIEEMSAALCSAVEDVVASTAATVLKRYEETKGDAISQRQAEREFGKKWLHDHIKVMGREIYTVGAWNPDTESRNSKKTFSRAQLAEIKRRETDIVVYQKFVHNLYELERGAFDNAFDNEPTGIREIHLKQRLEQKVTEMHIIEKKIERVGQERQERADRRKRRRVS